MKYFSIIAIIISQSLFGQETNKVDTVSFYEGGREMYSSIQLSLLADSTYHYYSWLKGGTETNDFGKWCKTDSLLVLNSTATETISKIRLTKKERKKQGKVYEIKKEFLPRFELDTFKIEGSKLMLYDYDNIEEQEKPFNKRYLTLYRR